MFTLNPSGSNAKFAKNFQADRVKNSINYLINECIKKLKLQDAKLILSCAKLNIISELSPEMHYLHYRLQTAMRAQDMKHASDYLHKIIEAICYHSHATKPLSISSIDSSEWENFAIAEAIKLSKEECGRDAEIFPISPVALKSAQKSIAEAFYTIENHDPEMFEELQEQVKLIKLFQGKVTMGFTDERILGAMMLRIPGENINPVSYYIEHIVHETSHMQLNCLMAIDALILNSRDEKFISPIRPDPRPMTGVFHATYVSARIARTFLQIYQSTKIREILHPLTETLDETIRGLNEIERNAKLTEAGMQLVDSIREFLNRAIALPEWKSYAFHQSRPHRYGRGETKVNTLAQVI